MWCGAVGPRLRVQRERGGLNVEEFDNRCWEWTVKAMEDLDAIAKDAREAMKAPGLTLAQKLAYGDVVKNALMGRNTVTRIFGKAGT
jgi:hypothetical protein